MSTNTCLVLPWHVRLSQRNWLRSHVKKVLLPSATVLPVKVMTRFVSNWQSRHWLRIWRSSLHGVWPMYGPSSPVKTRSNTVKNTVSTCRSTTATATAVTVTYGTSATKVWSWKIRQTSRTSKTCWCLAWHRNRLRKKGNMLPWLLNRGFRKHWTEKPWKFLRSSQSWTLLEANMVSVS